MTKIITSALLAALLLLVIYLYPSKVESVYALAEYDHNNDQKITAIDIGLVAQKFWQTGEDLPEDHNGDGKVTSIDLMLVAKNFDVDGNGIPDRLEDQWTSTPTSTISSTPLPTATPLPTETRNKYLWPFSVNSIWNMPIGSDAVYLPAGLQDACGWYCEITKDREFISVDPSFPVKTLSNGERVRVDPNMSHDGSWNGCATFLTEDDLSIWQGQPLSLSKGGNPSWQYTIPNNSQSLTGDGRLGCHGGSKLSGIGGSLRPGELNSSSPIRHALKINVYAKRFLSCSNGGFRWPAAAADAYMDCTTYGGKIPDMRMGSLVAILPSVNCDTFVASTHAKKICHAFQDYGAYVVDDTFWDVHAINVAWNAEFGDGGSFHSDVMKLFRNLNVVTNNSSTNIGGGGILRAPLAPPFGN